MLYINFGINGSDHILLEHCFHYISVIILTHNHHLSIQFCFFFRIFFYFLLVIKLDFISFSSQIMIHNFFDMPRSVGLPIREPITALTVRTVTLQFECILSRITHFHQTNQYIQCLQNTFCLSKSLRMWVLSFWRRILNVSYVYGEKMICFGKKSTQLCIPCAVMTKRVFLSTETHNNWRYTHSS